LEVSKSKKVMKKFRIISLVLALVIAVGLFAGCGKEEKVGSTEVTWVVIGDKAPDNEEVFKLVNEKLKAACGYTIKFEYIDQAQYDLKFAADDEFDLVICPDWLGYWQNVDKEAFQTITEAEFKKFAPFIWEKGQEMLNAAKFNGKYYAIPGINKYSPNRVLIARGDLMDKVGVDTLDTIEDIDTFLMGVADLNKKGQTNIVPYNAAGGTPWMVFSMWASDWGWAAPGSLSFGGHYYYSVFDDSRKLFVAVDKPEVKEYSQIVKKWYDNGVFSKSVLSNNTTAEESYKNGKSAFAWTASPASANVLYNDLKKVEGADKWDTRFYSMYGKMQKVYGFMNSAVAIGRNSKNKKGALQVINAVYENEDIFNLLKFGIEGKHYIVDKNGGYVPKSETYMAPNMSIAFKEYDFPTKYDYPYAEDLVKEMDSIAIYEPLVNLPTTTSSEEASRSAQLNDIFKEYSTPRMYGAVTNIDKALAEEKKQLELVGIDEAIKKIQRQMDEYIKTHPEANEEFKATRAKVLDYKKKNPHKVNPKDYK